MLLCKSLETLHECTEWSAEPVNIMSLSNGENMPHKTVHKCFE